MTAALLGAGGGALAYRALTSSPPGGAPRWTRTNHRGEPITLLAGPALVAGAVSAAAFAPGCRAGVRSAAVVAGLAAGALGAYDDLAEGGVRKGLAGHLGALARGEVTTGAVKVVGLVASGAVAAALVGGPSGQPAARRDGGAGGRALDVAIGTGVVAGTANLLNLLDLRPGRAVKAVLLGVVSLGAAGVASGAGAVPAAALAGAALAVLPDDLAERTMLGDTGANAAGALLGVAALAGLGRRGRATALAALVSLTLASERISFTRVIESTPGLRELDRWGRRR